MTPGALRGPPVEHDRVESERLELAEQLGLLLGGEELGLVDDALRLFARRAHAGRGSPIQ
jgi:hypothetical protein